MIQAKSYPVRCLNKIAQIKTRGSALARAHVNFRHISERSRKNYIIFRIWFPFLDSPHISYTSIFNILSIYEYETAVLQCKA